MRIVRPRRLRIACMTCLPSRCPARSWPRPSPAPTGRGTGRARCRSAGAGRPSGRVRPPSSRTRPGRLHEVVDGSRAARFPPRPGRFLLRHRRRCSPQRMRRGEDVLRRITSRRHSGIRLDGSLSSNRALGTKKPGGGPRRVSSRSVAPTSPHTARGSQGSGRAGQTRSSLCKHHLFQSDGPLRRERPRLLVPVPDAAAGKTAAAGSRGPRGVVQERHSAPPRANRRLLGRRNQPVRAEGVKTNSETLIHATW